MKIFLQGKFLSTVLNCNGKASLGYPALRGSEITLYGEIAPCVEQRHHTTRPKMKTNGHFSNLMQQKRPDHSPEWNQTKSRPPRPGAKPKTELPGGNMTQSCPTPPQNRKKFFLSPKTIRSPFTQRTAVRHQPQSSGDNSIISG